MRILYSPQLNPVRIDYSFDGDTITVSCDGNTDEFDFSGMPDGEMSEIETTLSIKPIIKASKLNGVLSVELLNHIGDDATEEERFPSWIEV